MLTCNNSGGTVLLGVAILHADGAGVGFSLIGTQRLPLLLQAVLVLQVILHVGLEERTEDRGRGFSTGWFVVVKLVLGTYFYIMWDPIFPHF